jgi:hypothetical protein
MGKTAYGVDVNVCYARDVRDEGTRAIREEADLGGEGLRCVVTEEVGPILERRDARVRCLSGEWT